MILMPLSRSNSLYSYDPYESVMFIRDELLDSLQVVHLPIFKVGEDLVEMKSLLFPSIMIENGRCDPKTFEPIKLPMKELEAIDLPEVDKWVPKLVDIIVSEGYKYIMYIQIMRVTLPDFTPSFNIIARVG